MAVFSFLFLGVTQYNADGVLRLVTSAISSIFFVHICLKDEMDLAVFAKRFVNVVTAIAIVSLLFWGAGSNLGLIKPDTYGYLSWGNRMVNGYFNIYYEPQNAFGLLTHKILKRNCGFFVEGPMYSFILVLSLLFYKYVFRGKSKAIVVVHIATIVSTLCSTGYIMLLLIYAMEIIIYKPKTRFQHFIKVVLLAVLVLLLVLVWYLCQNKLESVSGSIRADDFKAGIAAWNKNKFFGNGLENIGAIQPFMSRFRLNNLGFSNSITQLLSDGGLYLFFLYMGCFFKSIKNSLMNKDFNAVCFEMLFILLFSITLVTYTNIAVFMFVLFSSGKTKSVEEKIC